MKNIRLLNFLVLCSWWTWWQKLNRAMVITVILLEQSDLKSKQVGRAAVL